MRMLKRVLRLFILVLSAAQLLPAQCQPSGYCVTSATISPGTVIGDGSEQANITITVHVGGTSAQSIVIGLKTPTFITNSFCSGSVGYGVCNFGTMGPGDVVVSYPVAASNKTGSNLTGTINVAATYENDTGQNVSITATPVSSPQEPPAQDPDGPCDSACGGSPINFTNGDTWIPQRDYSIPGLGGGLTLTRTWNSLWSLMQPVEQSGIFGDSWRSNLEERIQVQTGGTVKYWKGDGSSLFYAYSGSGGVYYMTAPADDQTTLSYDSSTTLWTVTQKDGTQKIFNFGGYLTSIVDRNDNTISINVDAGNQNRIASVTDAANRTLTFNYANPTFPRLCTSITDAAGVVATYNYDTLGRLIQVLYPDSSQFNFNYDSNNLILSVTDSQGKVIEAHTYDSQRRGLTSQQANDANGKPVNKVTASYESSSPWNTIVCDSVGDPCVSLAISNRAQRHYFTSAGSAPSCSTCGFLGGESNTRSPQGFRTSYTDPNSNTTLFTVDNQGNVLSKTLPGSDTWQYTYNGFGEVLTVTDPLGHVTTNQYDAHGNLLSTTSPSPDGTTPGSTTSFTYDSRGQLLTITDPLNNPTILTYTPAGLIETISDAQNNVTTYAYDSRGNRTSVIDAAQNETQFVYDSMNRLTKIIYPDQSTIQFGYDYRGRRASVTDQNNELTQYAYDDADRLISVMDAATNTTRYGYNTESDLTDLWDASNRHTQFQWISGRNLYKATFPSGYYETYTWDGTYQNLSQKTDRNGNTAYWWYDSQNRLYQNVTRTYSYDPVGRLSQAATAGNNGSTLNFTYDNMGRLIQTTTKYSFLTSRTFTVKYGYDAASNRTSMTDAESGLTQYTYDTLNRLTNLQDFQGHNFGFSYDQLSRRTQLTRPNGVNTNYSYDNLSRLLSVLHQVGVTTLDGAAYTYDSAGNRMSKTDERQGVTSAYSYDPIYELTGVTQGTTTTESYTYDAVGNRLSSLGMAPYSYNSSNELTATPTATYTYDKDGNAATKVDATGTTTYTWDPYFNTLNSVTLPGSGGTVSFRYDPFGRRIQKSGPSGTTNYLYDGPNLLEEVDNSGNVLAGYTQDQGIDDPVSMLRSGTTSYYQADALGTVTSLSNSAGALANTYGYDSFGNLTASSGTLTNPVRYTGREFDSETGLSYYRARYYDASVGRFISEDPVGFSADINFYDYVSNNPIDFIDPTGWKKKCTTRIMLVTAYCDKGPGSDWAHYKPRHKGGKPSSVGPGDVAVANSDAQPYPYGCSVTVSNAANGTTDYRGTTHDTGAGWDSAHHDVLPGAWIDIWMSPCRKARNYGARYRTVTICCDDNSCGN